MPNTYACKLVSNPNVPIFLPRVCTLVLFISRSRSVINPRRACAARVTVLGLSFCLSVCPPRYSGGTRN